MDKWVILGKPECQWCKNVADLLHDHWIEFVYMDITGTELTQFLENCGLTTVPQVYVNGHRIGGYEELVNWFHTEVRPAIYPAEWLDDN